MSGKRVLVIDDDAGVLQFLGAVVARLGHEVLLASNGVEGLQVAEREMPGVIITDIGMPGIDGVELTRRLKGDPRLSHIPIIAVTGGSRAEEARMAGCCDVLRKPFDIDRLALALDGALT